ncbi:hypothetical protein LINPERHAP2_LOCUS33368 [Linum perenne]
MIAQGNSHWFGGTR